MMIPLIMKVQQARANRALSAVPLAYQTVSVGDDVAAGMVTTVMMWAGSLLSLLPSPCICCHSAFTALGLIMEKGLFWWL